MEDKDKFKLFLDILPEIYFYECLDNVSMNASYTEDFQKARYKYFDYAIGSLNEFFDKTVKESLEKFNENFILLNDFFRKYFFADRIGAGTIYRLYPELKYSSEKVERDLWTTRFAELQTLVELSKKFYIEFIKIASNQLFSNNLKEIKTKESNYKPKKVELFRKDLKPETTIGELVAYNDGSIRFSKEEIKMRNQVKDLCRLFMEKPNQLITFDDIKDHIIHSNRRGIISFSTISKYVSELHNLLKVYYKKDVIFNQKEEGWCFKP